MNLVSLLYAINDHSRTRISDTQFMFARYIIGNLQNSAVKSTQLDSEVLATQ
jgi:hypothetical protein